MKNLILLSLVAAICVTLPACTTVKENPSSHTTTTTTEQSTLQQPIGASSTTETRSIRSY